MELVSESFSGSLLRPLIVRETPNKTGNSDLNFKLKPFKQIILVWIRVEITFTTSLAIYSE